MPYDYFDFGVPEGTFGNDDQYTGDTAEEFYDYLMTPRQQKRWSGSGAIKHYGPDRYASINPEDAAMADILMKQIEAKREMDFNVGARASAEARRGAADELMMPQGRGGGSISFTGTPQEGGGYAGPRGSKWGFEDVSMPVGGGMPTGPPKPPGPMDERGRMIAAGGGYPESRVEAAKQNQYGRARGPSPATPTQIAAARRSLMKSGGDLERHASYEEGWGGLEAEEIFRKAAENPSAVPEMMREYLNDYGAERGYFMDLARGAEQPREQWGG